MKFLVDNQFPPALARYIGQDFGAAAIHASDLDCTQASDLELWHIVSKDEDFVRLALVMPGRLLWVRLGNYRKRILLEKFLQLWPQIVDAFQAGEKIVELR